MRRWRRPDPDEFRGCDERGIRCPDDQRRPLVVSDADAGSDRLSDRADLW